MANIMQQVRTSTTGKLANSTNNPSAPAGQIMMNITDGKVWSTNGTNFFEIGGNVTTVNVSSTLNITDVNGNLLANSSSLNINNYTTSIPLNIYGNNSVVLSQIIGDGIANTTLRLENYYATGGGDGVDLNIYFSRGTYAAPTQVVAGDKIGQLRFAAMSGSVGNTTLHPSASIEAYVDAGTISNTSNPGRISFFTTSNGVVSLSEALRLDSYQNVTVPGGNLIINTVAGFLIVGNSSVKSTMNSSYVTTSIINTNAINITNNPGLTLGTSSLGSSGYTYLPNGILMQWGVFATLNTTAQLISFPIAYSTNCFSFLGTLNGAATIYINSLNSTAANVASGSGLHTVLWTAFGH